MNNKEFLEDVIGQQMCSVYTHLAVKENTSIFLYHKF